MASEFWLEINQFLIHEARLLDERRFEEWLTLFTEDATYWMPGRTNPWRGKDVEDSINKPGDLAVFEDTKATLTTRVERLRTGLAWGEDPPSRTRHLITNVEVEVTDDAATLKVRSNFLVYRAQLEDDKDIFVGSREDRLLRIDGAWKISSRSILMEDVVHNSKPLSIFF
ncbi:MAG: 3-phenylpropionate/cinnamic acid dioxygenase subunit beta [Rhodospirillaceae bacterium]|nr:3-phenylpropionate/cinnamic acid dioxygenase subunit beta [Rhodospirillaceae bacterium]MBT5456115.1 3-phenylpropionate/cinnamic acid dioxygenase subunit beta [Rhodospirillaceae bacterium]